jgi:ABC-2 type transport system ATP-binding protein
MIEARELTKRYGDTTAVHSLSFTIAPGTVTGKPYRQHRAPLREVGPLLEASAVHPGRSARSHLRSMAATHNRS